MLLCWKLGKPTAREVHEVALERRERDYRTILATLNNIAAKGFLEVEKHPGPRNIPTNRYVPAMPRREGIEMRIRNFLDHDLEWDSEALDLLRLELRKGPGGRLGR